MLIEGPIFEKNQDKFERNDFSSFISEILILSESSPSLVVALEGEWGVGKTSTINLIKNNIRSRPEKPIIIDFNPWLIGSLDSVIEGFLIQFASSINQNFNSDIAIKTSKKLLNFAKFLSPIKLIPSIEPWGTLVEKVLSSVADSAKAGADLLELNLIKRKQSVQEAITELNQPIIVIIDDIDRLPPNEIRIIIQVVKAIGDFNRVSYLLAYDPKPIIKALSYNETYDGRMYLEKIIQVSYPIPRVGFYHKKIFLEYQLKNLQSNLKIELGQNEKLLLNEAINSTALVHALATPRDVIRLIYRMLNFNNIKGEVCFADALAFETLVLKYPEVSNAVYKYPEYFIGREVIEGNMIIQDHLDSLVRDKEDEPHFLNEYINGYNNKQKKHVYSILNFIFPKTFQSGIFSSEANRDVSTRIKNKKTLLRLLHSGPTQYTFSIKEIRSFLENQSGRNQILIDKLEGGTIAEWLPDAADIIKDYPIKKPESLIHELFDIFHAAYNSNELNLTDEISRFIVEMINNIKKTDVRKKILYGVSETKKEISISEKVLLRYLETSGMWDNGIYSDSPHSIPSNDPEGHLFDCDTLKEAKKKWLKNIRKRTSQDNRFFKDEPGLISIFFRWGQLNDNNYSEVKRYIEKQIEDEDKLKFFLELFYKRNHQLSDIEKLIEDIPKLIKTFKAIKNKSSLHNEITRYLETDQKFSASSNGPSETIE